MEIKKTLEHDVISVLGNPVFLQSITDAVDYGFLCENGYNLAFCLKKKYHFWKIVTFPAPIAGRKDVLPPNEQKAYFDKAIKCLETRYGVDEFINVNTSSSSFFPTDSYYCKFGSYILDLNQTEDELFAGLHSKHRNVIRKAEKDGLTVDFGPQYLNECANIMDDTFHRQGKMSNSYNGLKILSNIKDQCDFWVVKSEDEIQGCAILLWDQYSSYYLYGGSAAHTHSGAMNLLHWKAILKMKERGVKYYDFVGARLNPDPGSKLEGIQRFKSRFGGPMKVGYLWRYDAHPLKMKLYRFLMKIYFRLHGDDSFKDIISEERAKGNC